MQPRVVIIGAGFGGLYAVRALRHAPVEVIVLDRRNHHVFQPLLYQVATAALNPSDIAYPVRSTLRHQKNATVLLEEARAFDLDGRRVITDVGVVPYDYLIVATGATHSYFGHDEWKPFAPGLKTIEDALEIRRRILYAFEAAEREDDPAKRREWLNFVVIGGGATGVELAGAIAEIAFQTVLKDFRRIDPKEARIVLLEGGPRIVTAYPESLSQAAVQQLESLGVTVRTQAKVTAVDDEGVCLGDERIRARTVIWGAGVQASPLGKLLGAPIDKAGRVKVLPTLQMPGHEQVFVIGDLAAIESDGKPVPGVAPAAMQMGAHAAENIEALVRGESPKPFHYFNKGELATIGRSRAIALFPGGIKLAGFLAWAAWLFIHILFIIGFRNRVLVMFQWFWAYLTFQRGARLITAGPPTIGASTPPPSEKVATEPPRPAASS